jgi:hypothetical protein
MWVDETALSDAAGSETGARKRGQQCIYADAVIQMLPMPKQVLRLPSRVLLGCAHRPRDLTLVDLPIHCFSMLSHHVQTPTVLRAALRNGVPLHLIVDSIGLKLSGEGERRCAGVAIRSAIRGVECIWQWTRRLVRYALH